MADDEKSAKDLTLGGLAETLDGMSGELEELRQRVNQLEKDTRTQVRVVDTERGKRLVLENRQQTWFSPNYFRTILERIDSGEEVEGEIWRGEEERDT